MEKFEPIDIDILINSDEVKADAKKAKDAIKGIGDEAEQTTAKVKGVGGGGIAAPLNAAGNAAEAAGRKAAAARPQWNGLGNSISQISRELPAFTYSAQTGFLAISNNLPILFDEIGKLRTQNDALVASGQKGVPIWKQIIKNLGSWNILLSVGVTLLTIYGKEVIEWATALFKGAEAIDKVKERQELLNKALEGGEFKKATVSINELRINLDLAKKSMFDKKEVVDQYNKSIGETAKKAKTLDDVEQGLVKNADAYVKMMLYKAAATLALEEASKKAFEQAKESAKSADEFVKTQDELAANLAATGGLAGSTYGISNFDTKTYAQSVKEEGERRKQIRLVELEKEKEAQLDIAKQFQKTAAEAAKQMGGILGGGGKDDPSPKVLNDRKNLLEKIADLDREYARKKLDRDGEELQALRDKFGKVRKLIEEFNQDPKNKTRRIDITGLGIVQTNAEADLVYKQETRSIKEELSKQKILYKEIEEFKTRFGIEKARERYGAELQKYDDYAAVVRQKLVNNFGDATAVDNGTATAAQVERVNFLRAESLEEVRIAGEKHANLLEEYRSYQEKKKLLTELFQKEYSQLILNKDFEEADVRRDQYNEDLDNLNDANLKKKESYKKLFEDVGRLSIASGKKIIANAKKLLETEEMSAEAQAKILKVIADTEQKIEDLREDDILRIAYAIGSLGGSLKGLGDDIGSAALSDIGGFLSGLASGVQDLMTALDEDATNAEKLEVSIKAVIKLMDIIGSAAAQRKAAEEAYYRSVIGFQNDYNLSLQEQIRLQSILGENAFIKDYEGRIMDANKSLIEASAKYQDALTKLEDGRVKTGQRKAVDWKAVGNGAASGAALGASIGGFIGAAIGAVGGAIIGFFGGKKKKDVFGDLLTEYPELLKETENGVLEVNAALAESLIANDLLDDATKQIVENVLEWQKAMEEARAQIREVIKDLTGSLSDDLRNALVGAFESGEDAAVKMGETVEKVLENIVSNLIFNRIFSGAFDKLEEQMAASFDTGGDGNWVDDFSRFFNEASGLTDDFNQALRDAQAQAEGFGFDIFKPDEEKNKPNGLQGAIRRELTEETGSELTGLFRGQYDISKRHLQISERHFELERQHFDATMSIMQSSALIEQNTFQTVIQLQSAVVELKAINTNTKPSQSARDIGKG